MDTSNLVVKGVFGSYLYGTNIETSDRDFKGVFMPSKRDLFLGRIPKTHSLHPQDSSRKKETDEIDGDLYSLHHFLHLAVNGQTVAIDMLFTPSSLIERGPHAWVWDRIIENRHLLLSKSMNAFIGYARAQATKYSLKGERLEKLMSFTDVLIEQDLESNLKSCWDLLPRDSERVNATGIKEMQIAGKWFGETTSVCLVLSAAKALIGRYGDRAKIAREFDGADWKAMSHAVRVSKELKEILIENNLTFPLKDRELLRDIRLGKISLESVQDMINEDIAEINILTARSTLPEKVNLKFWDDFLVDTMSK